MTSGELLQKAVHVLKQHGIDDYVIEARILVSHALGLSHEQLLTHFDEVPDKQQIENLDNYLARRVAREPTAHIVQCKEFYGLGFYVDNRVLIPRPETELLVEKAIDFAKSRIPHHQIIADIGTGSGVIAISLAKNLPSTSIIAVDISSRALEVAEINCNKYDIGKQITLIQGDLLNGITSPVDIIAANMPYIDDRGMKELAPEIKHFEPLIALKGGKNGLSVIERLLQQSRNRIKEGGSLFLEIGKGQADIISAMSTHYFPHSKISFFRDPANIERVVQITP